MMAGDAFFKATPKSFLLLDRQGFILLHERCITDHVGKHHCSQLPCRSCHEEDEIILFSGISGCEYTSGTCYHLTISKQFIEWNEPEIKNPF